MTTSKTKTIRNGSFEIWWISRTQSFEDPVPDVVGDGSVHEHVPAFSRGESCGFQDDSRWIFVRNAGGAKDFSALQTLTHLICLNKSHIYQYLEDFHVIFFGHAESFFPSMFHDVLPSADPLLLRCMTRFHSWDHDSFGPVVKSPSWWEQSADFNRRCSLKP